MQPAFICNFLVAHQHTRKIVLMQVGNFLRVLWKVLKLGQIITVLIKVDAMGEIVAVYASSRDGDSHRMANFTPQNSAANTGTATVVAQMRRQLGSAVMVAKYVMREE
jgi:hypothetical protein